MKKFFLAMLAAVVVLGPVGCATTHYENSGGTEVIRTPLPDGGEKVTTSYWNKGSGNQPGTTRESNTYGYAQFMGNHIGGSSYRHTHRGNYGMNGDPLPGWPDNRAGRW